MMMWLQWRTLRVVKRRLVRRGQLAGSAAEYRQVKELARKFVHQRLTELNRHYQFSYQRIAIKNNATRWGSCSKRGNLNFHYKVHLLPAELADYVLVHELCHLKELNHSRRFWELVAQTVPQYQRQRAALKKTICYTKSINK